jgi:hypothetical protein
MISFPLFPCSSLDSFAPSFFLSVSNLFVSFVTSCFSTTTQSQISLSKHFTVCRRISEAAHEPLQSHFVLLDSSLSFPTTLESVPTMLRPTRLLPLRALLAVPSPHATARRTFSSSTSKRGAIKSVGVIGSGQMGVGIAYVAARVSN